MDEKNKQPTKKEYKTKIFTNLPAIQQSVLQVSMYEACDVNSCIDADADAAADVDADVVGGTNFDVNEGID